LSEESIDTATNTVLEDKPTGGHRIYRGIWEVPYGGVKAEELNEMRGFQKSIIAGRKNSIELRMIS